MATQSPALDNNRYHALDSLRGTAMLLAWSPRRGTGRR